MLLINKHILHKNTEGIAGREIKEVLGLVRGNTIRARHIGNDIMAALEYSGTSHNFL